MQAFVASLTAVLLFIHTVLGCCWHHAHRYDHQAAAFESSAPCCHHHQHEKDRQPSELPCKCKSECEGACTYVVPQKVTIEAPEWVAIDLLAVLPSLAGCRAGAAMSWETELPWPDFAPPLRAHLLHQVLLN